MHYKTCEICGLRSGRSNGQMRIFMAKFPLNEDRCKKWVKVTGKEDLVYVPIEKLHQLKHICGSHFLPKDFNKRKTQLKKNAIPSVGLTTKPLADELFIGFPLHILKCEETELSSIISMEHDYSGSRTGTSISSTSAAEPLTIIRSIESKIYSTAESFPKNMIQRMRLSPIPSTSTAELLPIECSIKRETCSTAVPSTSTAKIATPKRKPTTTSKIEPTTPRERKLLNKLRRSNALIKSLRKKLDQIEKNSSSVLKSLIESTVKNET